jgi:hypothetical protein
MRAAPLKPARVKAVDTRVRVTGRRTNRVGPPMKRTTPGLVPANNRARIPRQRFRPANPPPEFRLALFDACSPRVIPGMRPGGSEFGSALLVHATLLGGGVADRALAPQVLRVDLVDGVDEVDRRETKGIELTKPARNSSVSQYWVMPRLGTARSRFVCRIAISPD